MVCSTRLLDRVQQVADIGHKRFWHKKSDYTLPYIYSLRLMEKLREKVAWSAKCQELHFVFLITSLVP